MVANWGRFYTTVVTIPHNPISSVLSVSQRARQRNSINRLPLRRYVDHRFVLTFLIPHIVAILDAGRNALSFFMLLVVSLGLSVVRESLGKSMNKCVALTVAHFVFGGE